LVYLFGFIDKKMKKKWENEKHGMSVGSDLIFPEAARTEI
jgi:hypothetical protein